MGARTSYPVRHDRAARRALTQASPYIIGPVMGVYIHRFQRRFTRRRDRTFWVRKFWPGRYAGEVALRRRAVRHPDGLHLNSSRNHRENALKAENPINSDTMYSGRSVDSTYCFTISART
jgi:hypothetical protein